MKKVFIVLSIVLTLAIGTAVAYADGNLPTMNFPWSHHNNLEAKEWEDHFNDMDEFHNKNGFLHGGRATGRSCHRMMRGNK